MRKFYSIVALMMLCVVSVFAQDNDKKNVCIDEFNYNSSIGTNWVTNLRNNVIQGIMKTGRLNVIDIATLSGLPAGNEEKLVQLHEKNGVDILVKGHYNSLDCNAKTKDGKTAYESVSDFSLTLVDALSGKIIGTQNFKHTWYSGKTAEESITSVLDYAINDMKKFVDDNFKMEAIVKAIDQVDPKKGAKTVFVTVGGEAGIQVGQMFDVYQEIDIAGEKGTKQIGTAKAKEVVNARMTLCTITKGGVEIKDAFDKNVKLTVISRAKKDPFGLGNILN